MRFRNFFLNVETNFLVGKLRRVATFSGKVLEGFSGRFGEPFFAHFSVRISTPFFSGRFSRRNSSVGKRAFLPGFSFVSVGLFFAVFLVGSGCASKASPEPFYTRMFEGSYDEVWLATLKALNDYPLKVSNKDTGKIQSEIVNGPYNDLFFTYPEGIELPERFRYGIKFNFAKLVSEDRQPLIRIRVIKELEQFQDFYTGWVSYPSDGLEERLLLYRIEHILKMEKTLAGSVQ